MNCNDVINQLVSFPDPILSYEENGLVNIECFPLCRVRGLGTRLVVNERRSRGLIPFQDMPKPLQPNFVLDVEMSELFIQAGLQDRVIQVRREGGRGGE